MSNLPNFAIEPLETRLELAWIPCVKNHRHVTKGWHFHWSGPHRHYGPVHGHDAWCWDW